MVGASVSSDGERSEREMVMGMMKSEKLSSGRAIGVSMKITTYQVY